MIFISHSYRFRDTISQSSVTVSHSSDIVLHEQNEWDTMSEERYGVGSVLYGVEESI